MSESSCLLRLINNEKWCKIKYQNGNNISTYILYIIRTSDFFFSKQKSNFLYLLIHNKPRWSGVVLVSICIPWRDVSARLPV